MASRITRIIREAAAATTDAGRQAVGNRMAGLTDRARSIASRLRDGKAGRMVGHLMDRLRGDAEAAPRRSRRAASTATAQAHAGRGSKAATPAAGRGASRGGKTAAGAPARERRTSTTSREHDAGNAPVRAGAKHASPRAARTAASAGQANRGSGKSSSAAPSRSRGASSGPATAPATGPAHSPGGRSSSRNNNGNRGKKKEGVSTSGRSSH